VPGYACRPWRSRKHLCARGFATLIRGDDIRTGVTAILPHAGNLFQKKVPGAVFVGNAFGKLVGSTQVNELGEIETPILLTSTISGGRVADALISYVLKLPGDEDVKSVNPLVGETNDGYLNDIRSRPITEEDVFSAIASAKDGPVVECVVGAGTGTDTLWVSWSRQTSGDSSVLPAFRLPRNWGTVI
jgi:D-aminopeptidase